MIQLPVRLAISVPVCIAMLGGLAFALLATGESRLPGWIKSYQLGGAVLMAGGAALLLAIPNAVAALVANRVGSGAWPIFIAAFAATFLSAWLVQAGVLNRTMRVMGGFPDTLADRKVLAVIAANLLVCLATAAFHSRGGDA